MVTCDKCRIVTDIMVQFQGLREAITHRSKTHHLKNKFNPKMLLV